MADSMTQQMQHLELEIDKLLEGTGYVLRQLSLGTYSHDRSFDYFCMVEKHNKEFVIFAETGMQLLDSIPERIDAWELDLEIEKEKLEERLQQWD